MTKKNFLCAFFSALALFPAMADNGHLEGFAYGRAQAPTGEEWQAPEMLAYNKLQPRANFTSFASLDEARKFLPENSSYRLSLDGQWKFHFAKNPDERPKDFYRTDYNTASWDDIAVPGSWNIQGIQKDGTLKYGVPIYVNQWVIFQYERKVDDWKKGVMRVPPKDYTTYEYRNEVGSYKRSFDIPASWDGRQMYISFDGVDSFFYLWINGQYVGFSKNSRDAARFDITPYVRRGRNEVAVEVYRSSDGSFLEAQDMFRLPGIFRSVAVYSTPKVHISDLVVKPAYTRKEGTLSVEATVENLDKKTAKEYSISYLLYKNKLYSDENELAQTFPTTAPLKIASGSRSKSAVQLGCGSVMPWTGEEPHVYLLVAQLKDKKGKVVETVSVQTGFRTVEIKDTPAEQDEFGLAGRYFYVNNQPLKLKGVNRHETNPALGHAITRQQQWEEVMLLKRANINHVRTAHYPNDPYFYYLCNKYGIYLESEANIESHEYFYGAESLSHPKEWRKAHVARVMEMAHSLVNEPCIVIWSLGNEAGPGKNFVAAYDTLRTFDLTRPVQYERNNDIVDMGSNQYPPVEWVQEAVRGKMGIKYPFHISEYAHSMGNAVGNLQDYWTAIESTNFFCGGAIWDWIDQSMYNYTKEGKRYLAYGGDFGDTPNDGQFVMNGIIFGDMTPKPQYYEVKKVYQNVGVTAEDIRAGKIRVFNKNYYTDDLSDYTLTWTLTANGRSVAEGKLNNIKVQPRKAQTVSVGDLSKYLSDTSKDYYLNVGFVLKRDIPWAKAGYVQMEQQLTVQQADKTQRALLSAESAGEKPVVSMANGSIAIQGKGFKAVFDTKDGALTSLNYGGKEIFRPGNGPKPDAFRAWVNNDNWIYQQWYANGLHNMEHKVLSRDLRTLKDGSVQLKFVLESRGTERARLDGADRNWKKLTVLTGKPDFALTTNVVYTIHPDGSIENHSSISSNNPNLILPRLGYAMKLDKSLDKLTYLGRGPIENYPDRKTAQNIGIYRSTVEQEVADFPKPQDMGNHMDSRWVALTDAQGAGAVFVADTTMVFSALPWTAQELAMANHPHELPQSDATVLHLDLGITGLGGRSCGQAPPFESDRVKAGIHEFGFAIRPINKTQTADLETLTNVQLDGASPISISRDNEGMVQLSGNGTLYYKVNGKGKAMPYTGAFNLRNGGTVTAWSKNDKWTYSSQYDKIERISVLIKFASSSEPGEGNPEHLLDNDPNTYWHTMYSVTMANYPHWIDFDCNSVKNIKGFTYLPRQDSRNGNIKRYKVEVSEDYKVWKEVASGEFANNQSLKRVLFTQPVKARYLKFTALSSQDGQDFATGAEFSILEN